MSATCTHAEAIQTRRLPDPPLRCEECLRIGGEWLHLRMCVTCGKVGCCDNSPDRHARAHFEESEHPLIRSAEPDEYWLWCFADEVALDLPE